MTVTLHAERNPGPTHRAWHAVFCLLVVAVAATCSLARDGKLAKKKREQIEQVITRFMAANHVPGLSIAVVEHGQYAWSAGFGMADLEGLVPATSQTLYRLASVSKPITAVAAMQLSERGKLDLDAPVQKYCAAFPEKKAPITTRQLLGHFGGIRHYHSESDDDPEVSNTKHFADPIQGGLQLFANDPLVAKPGTKFSYSSHGYTVVGCAIEGAAGREYAEYMHKNVFLPAGMAHTQADDRYAIIPYRARFYHKDKSGEVVNADFVDSSYKLPAGGWLSSAEDMAHFEVAVLDDRLIRRASRDAMWTPQKAADGSQNGYALGWGWGSGRKAGFNDVGHGGDQQGTSTFMMVVPDLRAGAIVLMNLDEVDAAVLATEILEIAVGEQPRKGVH